MTKLNDLVDRYVSVWNEPDGEARQVARLGKPALRSVNAGKRCLPRARRSA